MQWIGSATRLGGRLSTFLVGASLATIAVSQHPGVGAASSVLNGWASYGGNAQHTAISRYAAQPLNRILWQAKVDYNPQYSGSSLLIHYGTPVITLKGTVVVPVKTGISEGFRVDAFRGKDGLLLWSFTTDYQLPTGNVWTPSMGIALGRSGAAVIPGAGGTVYVRNNSDKSTATVNQYAFYGKSAYLANKAWADANVRICTPIQTDLAGNMWFGYQVIGTPPDSMPQISSGIARIAADGTGTWTRASAAAFGDATISRVAYNCAPALSRDGQTVYIALKQSFGSGGSLVGVNSVTLAPRYMAALVDPQNSGAARIDNSGTASPTIGPDGDVFYGVLESNFGQNHARGFMLHFDSALQPAGVPGAFGWDDTATIIPSYLVPSYSGSSKYLIATKYNNYAGAGGNGLNQLAVLDPDSSQPNSIAGIDTMEEVMTVLGTTIDDEFDQNTFPGAVREWCINTAAVDPYTRSLIAGCEDGKLYRWDLTTNTLTESITLTSGVGEAYTPSVIGPGGICYAINNATLYAVGR